MNTWIGPWRAVSKTGRHVYGGEDIVSGSSREVHIAQMRQYAGVSLNVIAELKEVFNNLKSQGEFNMERIEAVDLAADSEEYVVKVKWVGLDEEETTWEPVSTIYAEVRRSPIVEAEVDEGSPQRSQEKVWHESLTFEWGLGEGTACCELLGGF